MTRVPPFALVQPANSKHSSHCECAAQVMRFSWQTFCWLAVLSGPICVQAHLSSVTHDCMYVLCPAALRAHMPTCHSLSVRLKSWMSCTFPFRVAIVRAYAILWAPTSSAKPCSTSTPPPSSTSQAFWRSNYVFLGLCRHRHAVCASPLQPARPTDPSLTCASVHAQIFRKASATADRDKLAAASVPEGARAH